MKYRLIILIVFLTASSVRAAPAIPAIPACGSTILNYFPVSRIESITGQPVKNTGAFKKLDYGAKQFDVCSFVFEGQNNFIIGSFWEMDSLAKADALYTQLVETYQGDKNGLKIPAQKTSLDIADKSTLTFLKDFHPEGNLKYDANAIFTLKDNVVLFLSGDTSVISGVGLQELMRAAVGKKLKPTATSSQSVSPVAYPVSKNQSSNWISDNWKLLASAGGLAIIILGLLTWQLWIKRRKSSLSLPTENPDPQENKPPPSDLPPLPPQV